MDRSKIVFPAKRTTLKNGYLLFEFFYSFFKFVDTTCKIGRTSCPDRIRQFLFSEQKRTILLLVFVEKFLFFVAKFLLLVRH